MNFIRSGLTPQGQTSKLGLPPLLVPNIRLTSLYPVEGIPRLPHSLPTVTLFLSTSPRLPLFVLRAVFHGHRPTTISPWSCVFLSPFICPARSSYWPLAAKREPWLVAVLSGWPLRCAALVLSRGREGSSQEQVIYRIKACNPAKIKHSTWKHSKTQNITTHAKE